MRRARGLIVGLIMGALLLLGGQALAQSPKHFACYGAGLSPTKPFQYLPNGADPCPFGWTKIDWVDD